MDEKLNKRVKNERWLHSLSFQYKGTIQASKSIMNRALICSSYRADLTLLGQSLCDDVVKMQKAIALLKNYTSNPSQNVIFDCGSAGTVFRFLCLRLSRIPGQHVLKASQRLMQRPQQELIQIFKKFEVECEMSGEYTTLRSKGWQNISKPLKVESGISSQFLSGIILNSWDLDEDLILNISGNTVSEGYLDMTVQVVKDFGMKIEKHENKYLIKANSHITQNKYQVESDLSSAFAIAAYAVLNGEACFENFPNPSLQPDFEFINILKKMNVKLNLTETQLRIGPTSTFKGVEANLKSCPDIFPVLAILCAYANTPSHIYGAPQLVHKESNRIEKISELLTKINVQHEKKSDGISIYPNTESKHKISSFTYDTDHDHRLAFAAALVKSQNIPIHILQPEVVSKSFPEFWQVIGLNPNC